MKKIYSDSIIKQNILEFRATTKCNPSIIYAHSQELIKSYYKFILRIQPSLLQSKNINFGEGP